MRMTTIQDLSWLFSVEETYSQLIEHLSDRFTDPTEAINKATHILAKYYLNIEEQPAESQSARQYISNSTHPQP